MQNRLTALRVLHPFPSLLVAGLAAALVPFADPAAPASRYAAIGIGMLLYQCSIGIVNDLADLASDRQLKPWKPIPRGLISVRLAVVVAVICIVGGAALTLASMSRMAWLLGIAGLSSGIVYDVYLKRTPFSWLPYAAGFALLPLWVWAAADAWKPWLAWCIPFGTLLGLALNLANEAPDAGTSRVGLAARLGEQRSRVASTLIFAFVAIAVAALLLSSSVTAAGVALVLGVGALVAFPWAAPRLGRDGLFGLLACSTAALAMLFLTHV